jgi:hypothetical protein
MNGDIIVPIFFFGGTAAVLWKFFDGRNKERMAMIDKGVSPSDFKSDIPAKIIHSSVLGNLKWGLLFVFVGIGLFVGNALQNVWLYHDDAIVFASVMIFGGVALVIYYFIAAKKLKDKPQE